MCHLRVAHAQQQHRHNGHGQNGEARGRHGCRDDRAAGGSGEDHLPVAAAAPIA